MEQPAPARVLVRHQPPPGNPVPPVHRKVTAPAPYLALLDKLTQEVNEQLYKIQVRYCLPGPVEFSQDQWGILASLQVKIEEAQERGDWDGFRWCVGKYRERVVEFTRRHIADRQSVENAHA